MTKIQRILDEEGLSVYRLIQLLGQDPQRMTATWMHRVSGRRAVSLADATAVARAISTWTKREVSVAELHVNIDTLRFV